jgi:hypothetical protein
MDTMGRHVISERWEFDPELLNDQTAAHVAGITVAEVESSEGLQ